MSTEAADLEQGWDPYEDEEEETTAELDDGQDEEQTDEEEPEAEEPAAEEETSLTVGEVDDEGFDPVAVASSFRSSGPGGRVAIWQGLSETEREQVAEALETPSQVQEPSLEGFEPVAPGHKDFSRTIQVSKSSLFGKIGRVRSGGLPASPAIRSQIEGLVGKALSVPESHPDFHQSVQQAAHLLTQLEQSQRGQEEFGQLKKTSQRTLGDGFVEQTETDSYGRERIRVFSSEQIKEASEERTRPPWGNDPKSVTLESVSGWSHAEKMRFKAEYPERWDDLLYRQSIQMDERLRTKKGVSG